MFELLWSRLLRIFPSAAAPTKRPFARQQVPVANEGAMDALLWILIGLAGGLTIAALAPQSGRLSMSDEGWRRVRAAAVGMVGALVAGYALVLFDPSLRTDGLTTAIASLAGALWFAAVAEAYSSRRRRGESTGAGASEPTSRTAIETPAYDAARQALVAGLLEDAAAHDAGRYADIGRQMPAIGDTVSRQDSSRSLQQLQLALRFWRGWIEARDERWLYGDPENRMTLTDWPRFARVIASDLALDRATRDPAVVARFA